MTTPGLGPLKEGGAGACRPVEEVHREQGKGDAGHQGDQAAAAALGVHRVRRKATLDVEEVQVGVVRRKEVEHRRRFLPSFQLTQMRPFPPRCLALRLARTIVSPNGCELSPC